MTVEEAVRQIRREAGRLARRLKVLEQVQNEIEAPALDQIAQMEQGQRPVSAGAHLIGVLQAALLGLEQVVVDLRDGVRKDTLLGLERDWQPGDFPDVAEVRRIRAGLDAWRPQDGAKP